ncbi:MAG: peptide ABC transporter substrate-binding protein [Anaerolineae bacterium]
MRRLLSTAVLVFGLAIILAACAGGATAPAQQAAAPTQPPAAQPAQPQAAAPTAAPKAAAPTEAPKAAAPTTAPAAKAAPTTAAAQPAAGAYSPTAGKPGGQATMAVWQEPDNLNLYLSSLTVTTEVTDPVTEGLVKAGPDGNFIPLLVQDIPDQKNGGVSADGKTVTWKLKPGIKWSDGQPLTCEDVKFTWQAVMTPDQGVISTAGWRDIDKVDCPDPNTVVISYKQPYAAYRAQMVDKVLPKHATGDPTKMKDWAYNTKPVGTGPYKVDEFQRGSYIALSRNENYREQGKPYLDKIIFRIVPSSEVAKQLLRSGEVDVMWNNTEADYPELQSMQGVKVSDPVQIGGERLILNLTKPGEPSDNKTPHPILGDPKVRQAIALGINKQQIIDKLLFGKALPGTSELNAGVFNCTDIQPIPYDPAKAKQLLDEAGWKVGADGIREKDGQKLRLKYQTTTGNKLREDSQVLVVEDMKNIGVDFYIENQPANVLISSWANKSPRKWGNFDIIMYTTNAGLDPHSQMLNYFTSASIPSPENQGGINYSRWNDPQTDQDVAKAGTLTDLDQRKQLYCDAAKRIVDGASHIYLYQRRQIGSYRDNLQNFQANPWSSTLSWNVQDWWQQK